MNGIILKQGFLGSGESPNHMSLLADRADRVAAAVRYKTTVLARWSYS